MKDGLAWHQLWKNRHGRIAAMLAGALLVFFHFIIFETLFPNSANALGHDYALFFPALLDGSYWQAVNGIWQTPWFTPSFCGGVPKFANPNAGFYSVPQFLSFIFSPLVTVKLTFVLFAAFGYWGFYLLLRRVFNCGRCASFLGAALFLFNGFYAYRIAIGHLTYHGFMLIPWIAYFNLHDISVAKAHYFLRRVMYLIAASTMVAYMVLSGMINLILPSMIAVGVIVLVKLLYVHLNSDQHLAASNVLVRRYDIEKLMAISFVALALSASQIVATQSFLKYFPRDFYPLPGVPNVLDIFHVIFKVLFVEPDNVLAEKVRVNARWATDRHEHELGISLVPLFILVLFTFVCSNRIWLKKLQSRRSILLVIAIVGALLLPVIVNFYTPTWNAILKKTPVIGSSSTLVRWYCLYIPITVLVATLCFDRLSGSQFKKCCLSVMFVLVLVLSNSLTDREYYHKQNYPPKSVEHAYERLKSGELIPYVDRVSSRDDLTKHASNLNCYEPIFGYLKEVFPKKTLHDGPVLDDKSGVLNIKNPACYLYPEENNCKPGDHFTKDQKAEAERFVNYKPFRFSFSRTQIAANIVSKVSWYTCVVVLLFGFCLLLLRKFSMIKNYLYKNR